MSREVNANQVTLFPLQPHVNPFKSNKKPDSENLQTHSYSHPTSISMAKHPSHSLFLISFTFSILVSISSAQAPKQFIYNGFKNADLYLDGIANIHPNGLLELTNQTDEQTGHAIYPSPLKLSVSPSFSTTFAFAINPLVPKAKGYGLAFVLAPSKNMTRASANVFLGLINCTRNGDPLNHVFAVEFDTSYNPAMGDINDNHVGIDVNSVKSVAAASASYYSDKQKRKVSLNLASGKPMQVWIDYDAKTKEVNVAIAPLREPKPTRILLLKRIDLSKVILDETYVGFSAATGSVSSNHYILGWSFNQGGQAKSFDLSKLPSPPRSKKSVSIALVVVLVLLAIVSTLLIVVVGVGYAMRRKKYEEVMEDWEEEYAFQRFSYKELNKSTKGFNDDEILGSGGFGKVYKGILKSAKTEVAIKRISHDSRQGMREFVSEVATMKRLRHRNLVPLLGYCRRRGELLLVYEFMPNGSLDNFLFNKEATQTLSWQQRFRILKGVASALLYLHEEWEQVVLHRDIKASNVLLDSNMEARLGDFGLARLHDHGTNPQTTHVVGTVGYLAPEFSRTGKPTTSTDVFAYGVFVLEVCCGRRPIDLESDPEDVILVDKVWRLWKEGEILKATDVRIEEYNKEEMELALKVGLLCAQPRPEARPSMRQAMQFLNGDVKLPELPMSFVEFGMFAKSTGTSASFFSEEASASISYCTTDSVLKDGR